MLNSIKSRVALLALASAFSAQAFAADVTGAGASFVYPVMTKWSADYAKATNNRVNYQSIGSGGGIAQIKAGTVDFGSSDAPLKPEELAKYGLAQFPSVIGGVVPVLNVAGLKPGQLKLDKKARAIDVDGDGHITAGDRVDWTIVLTNVGGAPVRDISVSDPTGGKVTCPATTLAPGAGMTCDVATHTITAAEADAGGVSNTAVASGTGVTGPMTSNPDTAHVNVVDDSPSALPDLSAWRSAARSSRRWSV